MYRIGTVPAHSQAMAPDRVLSLWTLYERPRDFPAHYVVRRHDLVLGSGVSVPAPVACLYDTIDAAFVDYADRTFLGRDPGDERAIVGSWI